MRLKKLITLTVTLFLVSCSEEKKSSNEGDTGVGQPIPTQIGSLFDRNIDMREKHFEKSIFVVKSEMSGTQGIAIYLGEYLGKKLFAVNKHIVHSETDDCNSMVSIVDNKNRIFLGCNGFILSFKDLDLSLITMDFVFDPLESFEFNPSRFGFNTESTDEQLTLRTIDHKLKALVVDNNLDCTVLDSIAKQVIDPHPTNIEDPIQTWSIPIGCDALPGDSGAPVYNADDRVVGLLWGGKHNKTYVTSERLKEKILKNDQSIWRDYNFMVPSAEIKKQLKSEIRGLDPNSEEFTVLNELLNKMEQDELTLKTNP